MGSVEANDASPGSGWTLIAVVISFAVIGLLIIHAAAKSENEGFMIGRIAIGIVALLVLLSIFS